VLPQPTPPQPPKTATAAPAAPAAVLPQPTPPQPPKTATAAPDVPATALPQPTPPQPPKTATAAPAAPATALPQPTPPQPPKTATAAPAAPAAVLPQPTPPQPMEKAAAGPPTKQPAATLPPYQQPPLTAAIVPSAMQPAAVVSSMPPLPTSPPSTSQHWDAHPTFQVARPGAHIRRCRCYDCVFIEATDLATQAEQRIAGLKRCLISTVEKRLLNGRLLGLHEIEPARATLQKQIDELQPILQQPTTLSRLRKEELASLSPPNDRPLASRAMPQQSPQSPPPELYAPGQLPAPIASGPPNFPTPRRQQLPWPQQKTEPNIPASHLLPPRFLEDGDMVPTDQLRINLAKKGYCRIQIPSDGRCLFGAFSWALSGTLDHTVDMKSTLAARLRRLGSDADTTTAADVLAVANAVLSAEEVCDSLDELATLVTLPSHHGTSADATQLAEELGVALEIHECLHEPYTDVNYCADPPAAGSMGKVVRLLHLGEHWDLLEGLPGPLLLGAQASPPAVDPRAPAPADPLVPCSAGLPTQTASQVARGADSGPIPPPPTLRSLRSARLLRRRSAPVTPSSSSGESPLSLPFDPPPGLARKSPSSSADLADQFLRARIFPSPSAVAAAPGDGAGDYDYDYDAGAIQVAGADPSAGDSPTKPPKAACASGSDKFGTGGAAAPRPPIAQRRPRQHTDAALIADAPPPTMSKLRPRSSSSLSESSARHH
jgi:hypothetical protein